MLLFSRELIIPFKRFIPVNNDRRESFSNILERLAINMALKLCFAINKFCQIFVDCFLIQLPNLIEMGEEGRRG